MTLAGRVAIGRKLRLCQGGTLERALTTFRPPRKRRTCCRRRTSMMERTLKVIIANGPVARYLPANVSRTLADAGCASATWYEYRIRHFVVTTRSASASSVWLLSKLLVFEEKGGLVISGGPSRTRHYESAARGTPRRASLLRQFLLLWQKQKVVVNFEDGELKLQLNHVRAYTLLLLWVVFTLQKKSHLAKVALCRRSLHINFYDRLRWRWDQCPRLTPHLLEVTRWSSWI